MIRTFSILIIILFFSDEAMSQHDLTISYTNIEKAEGQLMVMLGDEQGEDIEGFIVPVNNTGTVSHVIENLKPGKYLVKVFHDVDKNEELNTGTFGIPKEPYGFSNNARGTFGPPDVEDQLFEISKNTSISIELK